ncbi:hypothetical protein JTB14_032755 [Gonioctena quinquepunctata]|nr:hypothetical protein JTB14_032755 [Gonioctena quinquepunctata]
MQSIGTGMDSLVAVLDNISECQVLCQQEDASWQIGSSADDVIQTDITKDKGKRTMNNTLLHINIQCLNNKLNDVEVILDQYNVDVFCICEHWFMNNDLEYVTIPGYRLISYFSRSEHIHGGTAIFSKENHMCNEISEIKHLSIECQFEICGVSHFFGNQQFTDPAQVTSEYSRKD